MSRSQLPMPSRTGSETSVGQDYCCAPQFAVMQEWFTAARFGMFIHWGASSQRGWELSWPLVGGVGALPQAQAVSVDEYHSTAGTFNPVKFNPREWARL